MTDRDAPEEKGPSVVPVMDYEGSDYQHAFWEGQGREYEDAIERAVLRRLLPPTGGRIAEIGAGFGRLAALYTGYQQVLLFDYSRTLLADAVKRWGHDPRFVFIAGNLYDLPLASGTVDTLVMMRVMHHLADVPAALAQIERTLHRESCALLEYANKRNLKAIGRWLLHRQQWSPFSEEPVEFVRLNFDFHPSWMKGQLDEAGLVQEQQLALSHLRLPLLKRLLPAHVLVAAERPFLTVASWFPLGPSVLVKVRPAPRRQQRRATDSLSALFRCPRCAEEGLERIEETEMACPRCGTVYGRRNRIWDFKEPM